MSNMTSFSVISTGGPGSSPAEGGLRKPSHLLNLELNVKNNFQQDASWCLAGAVERASDYQC